MRTPTLSLIALLLPALAAAQPTDKDCPDFSTRIQAQGTYLAAQQITGQTDYHRLDRDGNGVACESIEVIQRDSLSGTQAAWTETVSRRQVVTCVDTSFALQNFIRETRDGFRGEGDHVGWTTMMQCVELHLAIRQNEP